MHFEIIKSGIPAQIIIENQAYDGVKRIGNIIADDFEMVCDSKPQIIGGADEIASDNVIIFGTLGKSQILKDLEEKKAIDTSVIRTRKEAFQIDEISLASLGIDREGQALLITGSDKRGTIYGMFAVSEICGVTSLVYMGDSAPVKRFDITLTSGSLEKDRTLSKVGEAFVSKVPSIEYRGFFINDEWPAFGGWCNEHFGGFSAECYEKLFVFLLRMRGNFLWPAMWSSIFSEDGPGIENARLADELGIIMGTSHHEPLCRAGEEWQKIYRQYGNSNAWNFISNGEAITKFWRDGLMRNREFENLITIGMRGEADSKLLGEDATMADNIKVVKDAILAQHKLIKECVNENISEVPRVLAIYKEVEDYYYGDETCEGLKDWDELRDVIFLLSDDNWANTRGLPKEEERNHPGGYGMYYHFDYHGGPISYEWQNTSRLTKTWEQLTQAYEYGVRRQWIVNVGDLKGNEYPLTYFMSLAYDFETWSQKNMIDVFVEEWIEKHFHHELTPQQKVQLKVLMEGVTRYNMLRKPEALNSEVYNPVNYREAERVATEAKKLLAIAENLHYELAGNSKVAFDSLFYYQMAGSLNILLMQVNAGIGTYLANNRSLAANLYADKAEKNIERMQTLIDEYNTMLNGKWMHMLDSGFTGFRSWDDYDWGYPVISRVKPIHKPKIMIGFAGDSRYHLGAHWQDGNPITNTDMVRGDRDSVVIYLDSRGDVDFTYEATSDKEWISFENGNGKVSVTSIPRAVIAVKCDKSKITGQEIALINVEVSFADGSSTTGKLAVMAAPAMTHPKNYSVEHDGIISMEACHYAEAVEVDGGCFERIKYLGRMRGAVKCFPVTGDYTGKENAPYIRYDFIANKAGTYNIEVDVLARNPVVLGQDMILAAAVNDGDKVYLNAVNKDYYAGHTCPQWCKGVLDNVRRITSKVQVNEGENHLYIYAQSPNVSFDKIVLYREDVNLPKSYLGPVDSYVIR